MMIIFLGEIKISFTRISCEGGNKIIIRGGIYGILEICITTNDRLKRYLILNDNDYFSASKFHSQ